MATNTNTDNISTLSADVYEIADFYNQIRVNNIPNSDETSSMVGIFGYINELFTNTMQNTIVMISENTNEVVPTMAKFTKNVLTHALNYGITNIYATPAVMTIMIYLPVKYIEKNFTNVDSITGKAKFILDKNIPITIDSEYEFHLDYDVIITRIRNSNNQYVYTAMYDLFDNGTTSIKKQNPISDITNPYITTLIQAKIGTEKFIAFSVRVHQVTHFQATKTVLTDNIIENKTITFDFDDQLAAFDIDVTESNVTTHITPIYMGLLDYTISDNNWCYYEYIDSQTIRILFSRDAYVPGLNAEININIYQTLGSQGNFNYDKQFRIALKSEKYDNYQGMYAIIVPLKDGLSSGGKDKKSVEDLKKIIPREASSRGAIINTTDLENFFNAIDDSDCKLFFKKKRDNPFDRTYYIYMLMRKGLNVYPANTINLKLYQSDFIGNTKNNNLSINPGTKFYYYRHGENIVNVYGSMTQPVYTEPLNEEITYNVTTNEDGEQVRVFEYTNPFLITIDDDLIASYLLTVMDEIKTFKFASINTASDLQFVSTNMQWVRNFYYKDDDSNELMYDKKYTMTVKVAQNNMQDYGLIKYENDADGNMIFTENRMKMYIVLYTDSTNSIPYRYKEAELVAYDPTSYVSTWKFTFDTDDLMDVRNRINILNVYNAKPESFQLQENISGSHGYMSKNTYARLYILADFGTRPGDVNNDGIVITENTQQVILYGEDGIGNRTELEQIIPTKSDIVDLFLKNEIYMEKDGEQINVVSIIRGNTVYSSEVIAYNNNENLSVANILRFLRNNKNSDFVQNILLQDPNVVELISSYHYEDISRYTLCNVMEIDDGLSFYHDYSEIMHSNVTVNPVKKLDDNGNIIYREVTRYDTTGTRYKELVPVYETDDDGNYVYEYILNRMPVLKAGYLDTEDKIQEFIYDIEERRKYIEECINVLEDTFSVDFKFVNTFGPSKTFYYNMRTTSNYRVYVEPKEINVYSNTTDEDNEDAVVGVLKNQQIVTVVKESGQWGYIISPYEGWIKLSDTKKLTTFIDNVAIQLKFLLGLQSSADNGIVDTIKTIIKEYVEDINNINELHMSNIITLIINSYRDQIEYFQFMDVNGYGVNCQNLYLYTQDVEDADVVPEFINIASSEDGLFEPMIDITVE